MVTKARTRLLEFVEQQLFRPILDTDPESFPAFRRVEVGEARSAVAHEHMGIVEATSEESVLQAMREASARARTSGLDQRLDSLGLPTFGGLLDELNKLAAELGVTAED